MDHDRPHVARASEALVAVTPGTAVTTATTTQDSRPGSRRLGWLDLGCGASGDMLLGALIGAGAPIELIRHSIDAVGVPVTLTVDTVTKAGLAATRVTVEPGEVGPRHRTWTDIRALLAAAELVVGIARSALAVFSALAAAEGTVHGIDPEQVHFHEVGAHDAVADVVGVCAALHALALDELWATPVALGGGTVRAAHGVLPVPPPAVLALVRGIPAHGGPVPVELCTPTGAALVSTLVNGWGMMPPMTVTAVGTGAGTRNLADRPNVLRAVIGSC